MDNRSSGMAVVVVLVSVGLGVACLVALFCTSGVWM